MSNKQQTTNNKNSLLAFSVAEAMITLLLFSVALAAAAPLFSQRQKSLPMNTNSFPSGMVSFFDLEECPSGWTKLDSIYDGAFIRNIGGLAADRGEIQASGVPNITGQFPNGNERNYFKESGAFYASSTDRYTTAEKGTAYPHAIVMDASRVSTVYQNGLAEVRPTNFALLGCIKD